MKNCEKKLFKSPSKFQSLIQFKTSALCFILCLPYTSPNKQCGKGLWSVSLFHCSSSLLVLCCIWLLPRWQWGWMLSENRKQKSRTFLDWCWRNLALVPFVWLMTKYCPFFSIIECVSFFPTDLLWILLLLLFNWHSLKGLQLYVLFFFFPWKQSLTVFQSILGHRVYSYLP